MQRVNEFVFYELAVKVHSLTLIASESFKYTENWSRLWDARESVDQLYAQRALNFTTPAATRLYNAISAILPKNFDEVMSTWGERTKPDADTIFPFRAVEIREAAKEFETVLRTECQLMDTYFVSKKGTHSTKDLIDNAHFQIPEPSRSLLPDQAKLDFDQAGRCLAFDVATAAAFHLLRGTESVLVDYYDLAVPGTKKASRKMRNWGVYIKLIRENKGDAAAMNVVDHIREVYRNPVTHPEENYTDERAQVLFGLCVSAVVLLLQATDALKPKGALLPFAMGGVPAPPLPFIPAPLGLMAE
ncbi:MAG TPA: hypothetical protein VN682_03485 [Terriglobales bacterium]|nr:hypothetical protein [Terriglobales bacterium]